MGEQNVLEQSDEKRRRMFMRALLADVWALEQMLNTNRIESGVRRIGAEQEMFLVTPDMRPASIAPAVLSTLQDPRFTNELAKFNLEANLTPRLLEGSCLRQLETELRAVTQKAGDAAAVHGARVLLTGILPTLTLKDLTLSNMTEVPRYFELNRTLCELRRSKFYVHIKGLDEVHITHDNMMLEACNTSFQLHLQVNPDEFVDQYNVAQAIAAPVLAAAVNSPLLFGQRLWAETRIALLQHSIDERSEVQHARFRSPRVSFGERWLKKSVLEIFRQDIARFRVILTHELDEDPATVLSRGETPKLSALRLHNGTIWHWNRACYGIINAIPHLRIEHRSLPSGPSVLDEVANASFFLGLMCSVKDEYGPIDRVLEFDHTKTNFYSAARHGLNAQLDWVEGKTLPAGELILNTLLPLARNGLKKCSVVDEDIDRYLGVIEKRVSSRHTGARWMIRTLSHLANHGTREMQLRTLTALLHKAEASGDSVHTWELPLQEELGHLEDYSTVRQVMSTRLFTARPEDIVDYVASIMHWERLRHVPVEDDEGRLVGIVSARQLLLLLAQGSALNRAQDVQVQTIMQRDPITVSPQTPTLEAIELMRHKQIGCLPVIEDGKLVGILTLFDLLTLSSKLLENHLRSR